MSRKPKTAAPKPSATAPDNPIRTYRGACDLWLAFGDGEYHFALGMPQIREIERIAGVGIGAVYGRTMAGRFGEPSSSFGFAAASAFRAEDINAIVRQALIGGAEGWVSFEVVDVTPARATALVEAYCPPVASYESAWAIAASVLDAAMHGREPSPPHPAEAVLAEIQRQAAERPPSAVEQGANEASARMMARAGR